MKRAARAGLSADVALALAGAGGTLAAQEDGDGAVTLTVGGRDGVRVEGTCSVRTAAGEAAAERGRVTGTVPFERRWRGLGLRCELRADGPATIEVAREGGSRSRASTSGGRVTAEVG